MEDDSFVFTELFLIEGGRIAAFKYDLQTKDLLLHPRNSEMWQTISQDFWDWWEKQTNFDSEEYYTDFAFISDTLPTPIEIPERFKKVSTTAWKLADIQSLCFEIRERYFRLAAVSCTYNGRMIVPADNPHAENILEFHLLFPSTDNPIVQAPLPTPSIPQKTKTTIEQTPQKPKQLSGGEFDPLDILKNGPLPKVIINDIIRK
jgi:hypothetical protein